MRTLALSLVGILGCAPSSAEPEPNAPPDHAHHVGPKHAGPKHGEHAQGSGHRMTDMHHSFDDAEKWAKVFDDPKRDAWQKPDAVLAWLQLQADDVVGDLGAGTGYFAVRIAQALPKGRVLANDIEPDMVRYLGERAKREGIENLQPVQGTASKAGFDAHAALDLVFVCDVYHHIADRSTFFSGLAGTMAPDGRIVVVDFDPAAPADAPGPPPKMRLSVETVTAELAAAGFALTRRDDETLPYQYMLEFTRLAE